MEPSDSEGLASPGNETPDRTPTVPMATQLPTEPATAESPLAINDESVAPVDPMDSPPTQTPTLGPDPIRGAPGIPTWGVGSPPLSTSDAATPTSSRGWRSTVVIVVAALLGSVVGGSIVAAVNHNGSTTTVRQISAGPALLNGTTNIESVIAKVLPAVVSIIATTPRPVSQSGFGQPQSGGSQQAQGTGMIITPGGEVLTNNHVISGATVITVTLYGQTKAMPATLVDTDPTNDVALLQITNASNLPTVNLDNSDNVQVGDAVIAIGNALGLSAGTPTVTQGIISAKGRSVQAGDPSSNAVENLTNMFQTDAAINPGNSGGPLVDSSGKVIGMNTAVAASVNGSSQAQNIGFAIPANKVSELLPNLRNHSINAQVGFLGVSIETLTTELRNAYNFIPTQGAIVTQVQPGSPAQIAGLQEGDVITTFAGKAVTGADQLQQAIQKDHPGQSVTIGVSRGQAQLTVTATLSSSGNTAAPAGN